MAIIKAHYEQQYVTPTISEVAVLMVGNGEDQEPLNCNIIFHKQSGDLQQIYQFYSFYSPLHYVLLFLYNKPRWHSNIFAHKVLNKQLNNYGKVFDNLNTSEDYCKEESSKHITMMQYYAYQLQVHRYESLKTFSLHRTSCLFQQYIVDSYACIEQNHLNYLNSNQKKIRAKLYNRLQDALTTNNKFPQNGACISQRIVLSLSFLLKLEECIPKIIPDTNYISLSTEIILKCDSSQGLIDFVFPELQRAILASKNKEVDILSSEVLFQFSDEETTYYSADSIDQNSEIYNPN
ncbi:15178_t:CDS:2 [Cetraspora pellucida]|uniref:15178_t:CDS:1 n=1 Tax=Cetraspora pellucida TaxID=1433469 RepID=A0A9N9E5Q7_9GLOM|nr:15178_t:CDS:2 [Cetraspora pellucida]